MMNRINIQPVPFHPMLNKVQKQNELSVTKHATFSQILADISADTSLKMSKHANERMEERNIIITDQEWQTINEKVTDAKKKGVNQPLVLMDQAALIVSAKNNTVITVVDRLEAKEQIFTNIDGTIVI